MGDSHHCVVCYDDFQTQALPQTLPCGHTFCSKCISKLSKNKQVTCPLRCPGTTHLGCLRVDAKLAERHSPSKHCEAHNRMHESSHFCVECTEFMCLELADAHRIMKSTRSHSVKPTDAVTPEDVIPRCAAHSGTPATWWCSQDRVAVCRICALEEAHKAHGCRQVGDAPELKDLDHLIVDMKEHVDTVKHAIGQLDAKLQASVTTVADLLRAADAREQELLAMISASKAAYHASMQRSLAEHTCNIQDQIGRMQAHLQHVEAEAKTLSQIRSVLTPHQLLPIGTNLWHHGTALRDFSEVIFKTPSPSPTQWPALQLQLQPCATFHYPADHLSVLDTCNRWYPAVVMDRTDDKVLVHFTGWSCKWDEWISNGSNRIRRQEGQPEQ